MKIGIRADASDSIGSGHVMRCLCLADELRSRGASVTVLGRAMAHLVALVRAHGHAFVAAEHGGDDEAIDAQVSAEVFAGTDWVVVDHYRLGETWERNLRKLTGARLMAIDDLLRLHDADVLLDQNFHALPDARYAASVPGRCVRLLGPRYALLRPEFAAARANVQARDGEVRRLLVFLGGADADNLTGLALNALVALGRKGLAVDVVIGASHPAIEAVRFLCAAMEQAQCHVQTSDMATLLARADLAIGAGGSATWERCALGVPALALCAADNQKELLFQGSRAGFLYFAEDAAGDAGSLSIHLRALLDNPGLRHHISRTAMDLVDGRGVQRVADRLLARPVAVRKATRADAQCLHDWRNHPSVRAMSRNPAPIGLEEHLRWFDGVLASPMRHVLIGESDGQAIGVVRFDAAADGSAEVSIYLSPERTGSGQGTELLRAAHEWLQREHTHIEHLHAEVNAGNQASHRLFERCGYTLQSTHYSKRTRS